MGAFLALGEVRHWLAFSPGERKFDQNNHSNISAWAASFFAPLWPLRVVVERCMTPRDQKTSKEKYYFLTLGWHPPPATSSLFLFSFFWWGGMMWKENRMVWHMGVKIEKHMKGTLLQSGTEKLVHHWKWRKKECNDRSCCFSWSWSSSAGITQLKNGNIHIKRNCL